MEWGRYLEAPIARKYSERTGRRIVRPKAMCVHPEYPWMIGHPDRFQFDPARPKTTRRGVLEVKQAVFGKWREWSQQGIPAQYYLQLQHYLAITGLTWGSFAVLFGGSKLVYFDVPRDDTLIALMIEREREFWDYVQRDTPPPMELGTALNEELAHYFPKASRAEPLDLSNVPEAYGRGFQLLKYKRLLKSLSAKIDEHEAWFKLQMSEYAEARVGSVIRLTWTPGERKTIRLDKLRQEYPEIAQALTETTPTRRFTITALEDLPEEEQQEEEEAMLESTLVVSARRIELD
jgi:predicted phage-related endonuclease